MIEKLYIAYPQNVDYKNSFAQANEKIGHYYQTMQQPVVSVQYFREAERLWTELVKEAPGFNHFTSNLIRIQKALQNIV